MKYIELEALAEINQLFLKFNLESKVVIVLPYCLMKVKVTVAIDRTKHKQIW